jgi:L-ornithine N5-oxygenase
LNEIIYSQKVEQGMEKGQLMRDRGRPKDVKINIINYTDVRAAEVNASADGSIDVVLEHILTGKTRRAHYEAVILGTGYSRQSWKEILFGRPSDESPGTGSDLSLRSLWPNLSVESSSLHGVHISSEHSSDDSPTNSDIVSSGLSDDHEHDSCRSEPSSQKSPIDLHIARNYRLVLPETFVEPALPSTHTSAANNSINEIRVRKFKPTIWLQGCNERTHGISDSLLR